MGPSNLPALLRALAGHIRGWREGDVPGTDSCYAKVSPVLMHRKHTEKGENAQNDRGKNEFLHRREKKASC